MANLSEPTSESEGNLHVQVGESQGEIVLVLNGSTDILKPFSENPPVAWNDLGCTLRQQFEQAGSMEALNGAIGAHNIAVRLVPEGHLDKAKYLNLLSISLGLRFEATTSMEDLNVAVKTNQEAIDLGSRWEPIDNVTLMEAWDARTTFLRWRFEWTGCLEDLNSAIEAGRRATKLISRDHPNSCACWNNLSMALKQRGIYRRLVADLSSAIQASNEAVNLARRDHPARLLCLCNLAEALYLRFDCSNSISDLNASLEVLKEASAVVSHVRDRASYLYVLITVHLGQYEKWGRIDDLDDAERASREAIELKLSSIMRSHWLDKLSMISKFRYCRTGLSKHLDIAVKRNYESLALTPANHPEVGPRLINRAHVLRMRFDGCGNDEDLGNAIKFSNDAVEITARNHPNRVFALTNLSLSFQARFDCSKSMTDLTKAIELIEEALNSVSDNHPSKSGCLDCLGVLLTIRHDSTGALNDLVAAISAYETALKSVEYQYLRAAYLNNLGVAQWKFFERTECLDDLNVAIASHEKSVQFTPTDDISRAARLSNLGNALHKRFDRTKSAEDLDRAIQNHRQATVSTSTSSHKAVCFHNLGNALKARFGESDALHDLDEAVEVNRLSVDLTSGSDPQRAVHLHGLGTALWRRAERLKHVSDVDGAAKAFEEAIGLHMAPLSARILSAVHAAGLYSSVNSVENAFRVMRVAVELLPKLSTRFIERDDRQHIISRYFRLAADACAFSVSDGVSLFESLRLLELGRGILANIHFETRSDIAHLQVARPELAERYKRLCDELNFPVLKNSPQLPSGKGSLYRQASRRIEVSQELDNVIALIRDQDGFNRFLLGPSTDDLNALASEGPVVFLNASPIGSDALVITSSKVERVSLTNLIYSELESNSQKLLKLSKEDADEMPRNTLPKILKWLWDNVAEPVLRTLGFTQTPENDTEWPHIWWIPVGLLSLFPIHAAGNHANLEGHTVLDRVISSYVPTAKALGQARDQIKRIETTSPSVLLVSMPNTPNRASLENTLEEIAVVNDILPRSIERIYLSNTTTSEVLRNIETCSIVHLACHGEVDTDPSQSQILLRDWEFSPCTVSSLSKLINLRQATFAYISTCHAAQSRHINLLDESINIAGGFLLAGFPSVIGTLWQIEDKRSVEIARSVYSSMSIGDGKLDIRKAAHGLHFALRTARADLLQENFRNSDPLTWAPYIHVGV